MSSTQSTGPRQAVLLVIDADPEGQRTMRDRLSVLGYAARSADDYVSAIDVISSTPPDAVLVNTPSADGDDWNNLQTELNKWGIPLLNVGDTDASGPTGPLQGSHVGQSDASLKLKVDAALNSRSLHDALMTENARLAAERLHDPLTGLFNRRYMIIRVEEEILRSSRRGHPISCLMMNVDGFDAVNENWGHNTGDGVLRDMAHLITRTARGSDIVCRYRDDQFLILLTDTDASGAQIAANRLRDAVANYNFFNQTSDEPIKLTTSIGVSYWQPSAKGGQSGTWEPQLLGLCERALKAAKQSGTNRLVILQAT